MGKSSHIYLYNYMTGAVQIRTKKAFTALVCAMAAYVAATALIFPLRTSASVGAALILSIKKVIPPLFAFSAAYRIIYPALLKLFSKTPRLCRLFGVDAGGMCMIFSGLFSGFPMGAVLFGELYRSGQITEEEGSSLMPYVNCAGASFLIGSVGAQMTKNIGAGALLFVCQSAAAVIFLLASKRERRGALSHNTPAPAPITPSHVARAISQSGASMLGIASFIVFFSVVGDSLCADLFIDGGLAAAVRCALEISSGASALSECGRAYLGFCVGFSGLSVYMQCDLASGGVAMGRYLSGKLYMCGACGASFFWLYSLIYGVDNGKIVVAAALSIAAICGGFAIKKRNKREKFKNLKKTVEKSF
ncbi:MAG: hypothetical protein IJQ37_04615 [Clostridia bacterium]|nr:hypothetical protein [Clostridia bacterium]